MRAYKESGDLRYLEAAQRALASFFQPTDAGGVAFADDRGDRWFEEYIVSPPTHILNGFIWSAGAYTTTSLPPTIAPRRNCSRARRKLCSTISIATIWDSGLSTSLTGEDKFACVADRWESYSRSHSKCTRALCYKPAFKLRYY